ncbi:MAG: hypothetical protein P9L99_08145 [Candidatus Lernaella stagnicola]|nr:hypothetical protein [Candidatus Lernaella stagnicola]
MRARKIVLITALLLAAAFVGSLLAAPMWELQDKTWWWLTTKNGNPSGFEMATYKKVQHEGEDCLHTMLKKFDGKKMLVYEWVRGKKQPLYSFTLKRNGKVIATGHNVPGGYEFKIKGEDVKITKEEFDFFAFDDQNIYFHVGDGETKELKIFCPLKGKVIKKSYTGKGEKKMKLNGQNFTALVYMVVDGTTQWEVKTAKGTRAVLVADSTTTGEKTKRVKKSEVKKNFPGKI